MIKVIQGDITTLAVDAIINAAKRAEREVRKRIADHTLVALTVMIAESKPQEKELMVNLVMTFLK